jgi:hypothetical protein
MSKADRLRLPEYLGHILQAIERIPYTAIYPECMNKYPTDQNFGVI